MTPTGSSAGERLVLQRLWALEGTCEWSHPRSGRFFIPNDNTHDSGNFLITVFEPTDKKNHDPRSAQRPCLRDLHESRDDP